MSKIMISELTETTSAPDESYIAIDNGETTNKITVANYNANANATAKSYAEAAQGYAGDATSAKNDAVSAKNETEILVGTASNYANAASSSADAAAGSASEASGYVGAAQTSASNALASARAAEASAANIENQVKLAKSWAVGNTGIRADEAVNNAMYYAGQAAAAAGGGVVSFNGRTGSVMPESGDYSSDEVAHVNSDSTYSNVETEINNLKASRLNTYASDASQWDATPTENSAKAVTSGGVKTAIDKKLSTYANASSSWDTAPTSGSTKPVTSGGVYAALHQLSHVGMIIHSTTLDTEAKVKAFYGGTSWAKIEGMFLLGSSATHAIGSTGGEETHLLSANEMPSHAHGEYVNASGGQRYPYTLADGGGKRMSGNFFGSSTLFGDYTGPQCLTGATGGGQAHNNMPPYKTVYIWERTA